MKIWKAFIFNLIMPVYALLFHLQVKKYGRIVEKAAGMIDLSQYQSFLDVGCGNGALCFVLRKRGNRVAGVDYLPSMAAIARRNLKGTGVQITRANILARLPFEDKSFDAAIASYVLHGMHPAERQKVYAEMSRVAGRAVIFYDYNAKKAVFTSIVELLEGGDYFSFIKTAKTELEGYFKTVEVLDVDKRAAWYVCII